jgi:hypothetical protein
MMTRERAVNSAVNVRERRKKDPCNYSELQGSAAAMPHTPVVRKTIEIIDVCSRRCGIMMPQTAAAHPC